MTRITPEPQALAINVCAIAKGNERYVILFTDSNRAEALRTLGRWASNPRLSFTWENAMAMGAQISKVEA